MKDHLTKQMEQARNETCHHFSHLKKVFFFLDDYYSQPQHHYFAPFATKALKRVGSDVSNSSPPVLSQPIPTALVKVFSNPHSNKCHGHFSTLMLLHQQHLTQSIILFHSDTLPPLALGPLTLLTFPLLTSCSFWISFTSFHSISLPNNAVTLGLDHVSQPTLTCQEVIQPKVLPPRCQCLPNSHHQPSLSHRLQIHVFDLLLVISTWLSNEHFNSYVSKTDLLKKQTNKKKTELLSH